jgi:hypothetical protein
MALRCGRQKARLIGEPAATGIGFWSVPRPPGTAGYEVVPLPAAVVNAVKAGVVENT